MITINNLNYQYPKSDKQTLNDINLTIESNQVFGLLGSNGAGKTTLISLLTGLLKGDNKAIKMNGLPIDEFLSEHKQTIGLVPQDFSFYDTLTVLENLQFYAKLYYEKASDTQSAVDYVLNISKLEDYQRVFAQNLSGGLKRRLNFAIGLVNRPSLVFMDEPTVGVDTQSRTFILNTIKELSAQGVTIIYTSHYLQEVEQICDSYAILDQGKMVYQQDKNTIETEAIEVKMHFLLPVSHDILTYLKAQSDSFNIDEEKQTIIFYLDAPVSLEHPVFIKLKQLIEQDKKALTEAGAEVKNRLLNFSFGRPTLESRYLQITNPTLRD